MLGQWNVQWLNQNSQRSYPLADWGSAVDQTGTVTIPDEFILALSFPVHAGQAVEPEKFYIKHLGVFPTGYTIVLGYDDGSAVPPSVASVNIAKTSHNEYSSYAISGADDYDDSVGKIVIGKLDEMSFLPPGFYTFDPEATPIETDAIRPMIRGISSIVVINGSDRSDRIYGDIELVAGSNMRIVSNQVEGEPPQIVFSAISGEGLNEECACDEEGDGPCIRFINGIPPLPDGNFRMVGNKCMDIQPIDNGLRFSDLCSEPCCGCQELEAIITQINRFADGVATLQTFASTLGSEVTQMSNVVLGSKLSDTGCLDC